MIRVLVAIIAYTSAAPPGCDTNLSPVKKEGNVGETAIFPWLGVLRVHIHQGEVFKVALTGLVLVKINYAIANADDVARIPKRIFQEDSKAMFIAKDASPWFCGVLDYMTHPEYEFSTMNTIALIELNPGEENEPYPMRPICWPPYSYNTSNNLYAVGFTDDNQLLEKSVYSLQYVDHKMCEEFYNRVGLMESKLTPTHSICAFAQNNKENCVWDNGVVLASNTTKLWTLIGFGVRGPGCAAPARFINMQEYFPWIDSATNLDGVDDPNYRRSAFNEGFKKVPRVGESMEGETPDLGYMIQNYYPFDTDNVQTEYFTINRIGSNAINIVNVSLPAEEGNCSSSNNELLYRDLVTVTQENGGQISYRLSMYDLYAMNYSCAKIWIRPQTCNDTVSLYYMLKIDNAEGTSFTNFGSTPEHLLQVYPLPIREPEEPPPPTPASEWKPGKHLKVAFLEDDRPFIDVINYNVYLQFEFQNEGIISVEILGPLPKKPKPPKKQKRKPTTPKALRAEGNWGKIESKRDEFEVTTEVLVEVPTLVIPPPMQVLATSALVSGAGKIGSWTVAVQLLVILVLNALE